MGGKTFPVSFSHLCKSIFCRVRSSFCEWRRTARTVAIAALPAIVSATIIFLVNILTSLLYKTRTERGFMKLRPYVAIIPFGVAHKAQQQAILANGHSCRRSLFGNKNAKSYALELSTWKRVWFTPEPSPALAKGMYSKFRKIGQ